MEKILTNIFIGLIIAGMGFVILSEAFTWKLFFGYAFIIWGAIVIASGIARNI